MSNQTQTNETQEERYQRRCRIYKGCTIVDLDLIMSSSDPLARLGDMLKEQGLPKKYIDDTVATFQRELSITRQRAESKQNTCFFWRGRIHGRRRAANGTHRQEHACAATHVFTVRGMLSSSGCMPLRGFEKTSRRLPVS